MKHLILFVLIFVLAIGFTSCKSDVKGAPSDIPPEPTQVPQAPEQITEVLSKEIMTSKDWDIKHISINGQIQDEDSRLKSVISFDNDGNYKWEGSNLKNIGKWTLNQDASEILLESSDSNLTSEWMIKYRRSVMVWIGTSTFGNNSTQMMLNTVRNVGASQ